MSDTIQKYKDYVMTGFMKSVVPIVIEKAKGATITDVKGREYLDCFSGISVVNAGHGNPDVIAAANDTPYGLAAYVFTNDLTVATRMSEGLEAGIIFAT